jgi:hypothetical protein
MAELPKIVRARLMKKTDGRPAEHLDPNLLAAFAEHTLLEREREAVAAHLAECAECRECLALAFATREPEAPAVAGHRANAPVRNWFQSWRWVASAAVACCVVAVALQYHMQPVSLRMAKEPAPAASSVSEKLETQLAAKTAESRKLKVEKHVTKRVETPLLATELNTGRQDSSPKPLAQPVREATELPKDSTEAAPAPAAAAATAFLAPPRATAPANTDQVVEHLRMAARAPMASVATFAKVPAGPGVLWSINASPGALGSAMGVVERSVDAGKTWEVVPLSDRVSFRAVAAAGPDVWAGGSDGAFFHSSDGGLHWIEVRVAGDNTSLTGAIVSIDAANPSRLRIATSSGEEWISSDGGRHWKPQ